MLRSVIGIFFVVVCSVSTSIFADYEPTQEEFNDYLEAVAKNEPKRTLKEPGQFEDHEKYLVLRAISQNIELTSADAKRLSQSIGGVEVALDPRQVMLKEICPTFDTDRISDIDPAVFRSKLTQVIANANERNAEKYKSLRATLSIDGYTRLNAEVESFLSASIRTKSNTLDIYDVDPRMTMWMLKQDCDDKSVVSTPKTGPSSLSAGKRGEAQ